MKFLFSLGLLSALASLVPSDAATVWDLRTDWSNASNPNGVWSYNAGSSPLPYVAQWRLDLRLKGWGPDLPFWFKSTLTTSPEFQQGDVIVHTQDNYNGSGYGPANVKWTSPITGRINISGAVWMAADTGSIGGGPRGNRWNLYIRDILRSTGTIGGGDPYNRVNPFRFELGSGGPSVLENVRVSVGDAVRLEIVRTSLDGYFVGANLSVTHDTNSAPRLRIRVSEVELCWDTLPERLYQLQFRSALTTNQWVPFGLDYVRGTGGEFCTNDIVTVEEPQRYYRLVATNAPSGL